MLWLAQLMPEQFTSGVIGPCPDNAEVCATLGCPNACNSAGLCANGKCYCDLDATGATCETKIIANGSTIPTPGAQRLGRQAVPALRPAVAAPQGRR
jgi:hypothetical protein